MRLWKIARCFSTFIKYKIITNINNVCNVSDYQNYHFSRDKNIVINITFFIDFKKFHTMYSWIVCEVTGAIAIVFFIANNNYVIHLCGSELNSSLFSNYSIIMKNYSSVETLWNLCMTSSPINTRNPAMQPRIRMYSGPWRWSNDSASEPESLLARSAAPDRFFSRVLRRLSWRAADMRSLLHFS